MRALWLHPPISIALRVVACLAFAGLASCTSTAYSQPENTPLPVSTSTPLALASVTVTPRSVPPATATPTLTTPTVPATMTPTLVPTPECQPGWCVYPAHLWLKRPVSGPLGDSIDPSYRYGETQNGTREEHSGVEFPAQFGQPVFAAADGRVLVAGDDKLVSYSERAGFYGNLVIIEHQFEKVDGPVYTLYAHLSGVNITVGDTVSAGDLIGAVGASGWANGPHLHFEVRVGENSFDQIRNPELWIAPRTQPDGQLDGAFAGRLISLDGFDLNVESVELQALYGDEQTYYVRPYVGMIARPDDAWQESFALGDLPPGDYQWSFVARGQLWKGIVPIRPGQTTVIDVAVE